MTAEADIHRSWRERTVHAAQWLALPVALLVFWQLGSMRDWFSEQILPPPGFVLESFDDLVKSGDLLRDIKATLARIAAGFLVGGALGIVAGGCLGLSRAVERTFSAIVAGVAQVPLVAWVPPLVVAFGIDEGFRVTIIAIAAFFPIAISVQQGLKNISRSYREVAAVLNLPLRVKVSQLYLPGALPALVTGMRLGLSKSFMIVVFAELFAASAGLGHMMDDARRQFAMDVVLIGCVVIGMLGLAFDQGIAAWERRVQR